MHTKHTEIISYPNAKNNDAEVNDRGYIRLLKILTEYLLKIGTTFALQLGDVAAVTNLHVEKHIVIIVLYAQFAPRPEPCNALMTEDHVGKFLSIGIEYIAAPLQFVVRHSQLR